ncbi:hypothetical protein BDY21DRAFT_366248 [Lineolata rhizophorae]|uniref:Uncharacterized protein n=1 Tax=Lineolata rhizophorae TaxID=578093 RepID=A0A6A6NSS9_9PEZI|nr:hypothetical protein BDY21DRAFT_366248 [Lineolata rhizophorae]
MGQFNPASTASRTATPSPREAHSPPSIEGLLQETNLDGPSRPWLSSRMATASGPSPTTTTTAVTPVSTSRPSSSSPPTFARAHASSLATLRALPPTSTLVLFSPVLPLPPTLLPSNPTTISTPTPAKPPRRDTDPSSSRPTSSPPTPTPAGAGQDDRDADVDDEPPMDPFEPLGRALSRHHRRVRHVPFVPRVGLTATHGPFVALAGAVIVVVVVATISPASPASAPASARAGAGGASVQGRPRRGGAGGAGFMDSSGAAGGKGIAGSGTAAEQLAFARRVVELVAGRDAAPPPKVLVVVSDLGAAAPGAAGAGGGEGDGDGGEKADREEDEEVGEDDLLLLFGPEGAREVEGFETVVRCGGCGREGLEEVAGKVFGVGRG